MSRRNEIYVSGDTWRMLYFLSQASGSVTDEFGVTQKTTPDQIADQILRQAIREQHPTLQEHQKQIDQLEKQLIESLQKEQK